MAENESLDVRISRRWASFMKALYGGEAIERMSDRFFDTLKSGWKQTQKQLKKYGTSLEEVCEKTLGNESLDPIFLRTLRHEYVKLFEIEQKPFDSARALLERVVCASAERVLDQVRHEVIGTDLCPNVGQWNTLKQNLLQPIVGRITQLAETLADRPNAPIRSPAKTASDRVVPPGASFVHLSLLNPSPQVSNGARA